MDYEEIDYEENVWLREGTTVFIIQNNGFYRGRPRKANQFTIRIDADNGLATNEEAENLAEDIRQMLNARDRARALWRRQLS